MIFQKAQRNFPFKNGILEIHFSQLFLRKDPATLPFAKKYKFLGKVRNLQNGLSV